jgi:hypothetical protein
MKKIGDLMAELGFNKNAPQSVKEAFIKNLIRSAYGVEVQTPSEKGIEKNVEAERVLEKAEEQLSFDFTKNAS